LAHSDVQTALVALQYPVAAYFPAFIQFIRHPTRRGSNYFLDAIAVPLGWRGRWSATAAAAAAACRPRRRGGSEPGRRIGSWWAGTIDRSKSGRSC